jgi:hypothetical protein
MTGPRAVSHSGDGCASNGAMSDGAVPSNAFGRAVCEVCARPMPEGSRPRRVGACEFPFNVHDECIEQMGSIAAEVEEMCAWSKDQPEGLLYLGSWEPLAEGTPESAERD